MPPPLPRPLCELSLNASIRWRGRVGEGEAGVGWLNVLARDALFNLCNWTFVPATEQRSKQQQRRRRGRGRRALVERGRRCSGRGGQLLEACLAVRQARRQTGSLSVISLHFGCSSSARTVCVWCIRKILWYLWDTLISFAYFSHLCGHFVCVQKAFLLNAFCGWIWNYAMHLQQLRYFCIYKLCCLCICCSLHPWDTTLLCFIRFEIEILLYSKDALLIISYFCAYVIVCIFAVHFIEWDTFVYIRYFCICVT